MSIAEKMTTIANNVPQVYQSGHTVGFADGYNAGYESGYTEGEEWGFGSGRSDNESMVVSALESPVQKVEDYVSEVDYANRDSISMITYLDENIPEVYENGKNAGQQTEYDRFWNTLQQNGERTNYAYAFAGPIWTSEIFKPKYPIHVSGTANYMFAGTHIDEIIDIDFSNMTGTSFLMYNIYAKKLGVCDFRKATSLSYLFDAGYSGPVTIEKIYFREDCTFGYAFRSCNVLEHMIVEGAIGQTIDLSYSPLDKASIISIINALSTTASGKTVTFKKTAVNTAFETSKGTSDGSISQEWLDLIATKQNWTISLV